MSLHPLRLIELIWPRASETPQPRLSTWPWGWLTRAAEAWRQVGRSALTSDWQRCSLPFSYWKSSLSTLVDRFCLLLWWPWEIHSLLRLVSYDLLPGIACALSRKTFGGLRDLRALASGVDSNVSANESGGAGCWLLAFRSLRCSCLTSLTVTTLAAAKASAAKGQSIVAKDTWPIVQRGGVLAALSAALIFVPLALQRTDCSWEPRSGDSGWAGFWCSRRGTQPQVSRNGFEKRR